MNFFNQLNPDQRQIIVRLPYRIGLWISQSDKSGGEEAKIRELQSLSNILHGFAQEIFSSEDVQHIMAAAIALKHEWPQWEQDLAAVPEECKKTIDILLLHADKKEIAALTNHLIEIGEAVAMSFCEQKRTNRTLKTYLSYKMHRSHAGRRRKSFNEYISISPAERKALKTIAAHLETPY